MATKKPAQKKTDDPYRIEKKRSGRYAVVHKRSGKFVNGREKLVILVERGILKNVKVPAAPGAAEAPAEGAAPAQS